MGCTVPRTPASRRPSRSLPPASCPTRRSRRPPLMPPPGPRRKASRSRSDLPHRARSTLRPTLAHLPLLLFCSQMQPPASLEPSGLFEHMESPPPPAFWHCQSGSCEWCTAVTPWSVTWEKTTTGMIQTGSWLHRQHHAHLWLWEPLIDAALTPLNQRALLYFCMFVVCVCVCVWPT